MAGATAIETLGLKSSPFSGNTISAIGFTVVIVVAEFVAYYQENDQAGSNT